MAGSLRRGREVRSSQKRSETLFLSLIRSLSSRVSTVILCLKGGTISEKELLGDCDQRSDERSDG